MGNNLEQIENFKKCTSVASNKEQNSQSALKFFYLPINIEITQKLKG